VFVLLGLTVFVSSSPLVGDMVHCRTPFGAWKHANRSYERGYLPRPPLAFGVEILPPPAPPIFTGVEKTGIPKRLLNWCDMSDDFLETSCPLGDVWFLLDAPVSAKEFSQPKALCLFDLVEPDEKVVVEDIIITAGHDECEDTIRRLQVKCRALEEEVNVLKEGMTLFVEKCAIDVSLAMTELIQKELAACASTMESIGGNMAKCAVDSAFAAIKGSDICQEVSGCDVSVEHYVDDIAVLKAGSLECNFSEDTIGCTIAEEEVDIIDASLAEKGSIEPPLSKSEERPLSKFFAEEEVDIIDASLAEKGSSDGTFATEDTDNIFYLLDCLKLRVYCFPRENIFVWNVNAKSFRPPLGPVEEVAWCEETFEEILTYTAFNKEENIMVAFDLCGDCSLSHLRTFQHRINILQNAGLNDPACDFLCKMFDLIEFVPQSYLKWFASECAFFVSLESKFFELIANRPKRNDPIIQKHMKVYSFIREDKIISLAPLHDASCMSPELEDYYNSLALKEDYFCYDEFDFCCDESCVDTQEPDA